MGKRSNYELRPRDKYFTPKAAAEPLKNFLTQGFTFCEPCAGDGRLVRFLEETFDAICLLPIDIEPNADWILEKDAMELEEGDLDNCSLIITNPPFTWSVLKPLMDKWISLRPTILLLPADFIHNKRMSPYMKKCRLIQSIRRVKWIEGSKTAGVDNYVWAVFDKNFDGETVFLPRLD